MESQVIEIPTIYAEEMVTHAVEEAPNECCGILSGKGNVASGLYRITNTVQSPYRYLMDPQQFLNADLDSESRGQEFVAFYHSHTHSPAYPSDTDVRMALQSGYLDVCYLLISLEKKEEPQIRAFRIDPHGMVHELGLCVV